VCGWGDKTGGCCGGGRSSHNPEPVVFGSARGQAWLGNVPHLLCLVETAKEEGGVAGGLW
jgi:hypothetical protein